jgi:ABC-2 type transport system ATP-binding protein
VEEVCSQVLILDRGRVLAAGSVGEVIATAAVERSAQLRVPVELVHRAREALTELPDLGVEQVEGRSGVLRLVVAPAAGLGRSDSSAALNAALNTVVLAGVPVLSFELHGARLSDAFLQMTRRGAA